MSALHVARLAARRLGLEVHRYDTAQSLQARFFNLLQVHKVDVAIDVGANDGEYGQTLRRGGFRGRIVSFEPLPEEHAALVRRADRDAAWTVADPMALGAAPGTTAIHVAANSKSSSILRMLKSHVDAAPQSKFVRETQVRIVRLDDVDLPELRNAERALLKIDTQGYEFPVLQGSAETLRRCVGVQLELSLIPLYDGQVLYRELIDWLVTRGFALWGLLPGFSDPNSGRLLQMDGLFFRE